MTRRKHRKASVEGATQRAIKKRRPWKLYFRNTLLLQSPIVDVRNFLYTARPLKWPPREAWLWVATVVVLVALAETRGGWMAAVAYRVVLIGGAFRFGAQARRTNQTTSPISLGCMIWGVIVLVGTIFVVGGSLLLLFDGE